MNDTPDILEVWSAYLTTRSVQLRNRLATFYMPLVYRAAAKLRARMPRSVRLDDLASAASVGLLDAIESFDPARNTRFTTFATLRLRGAMLDELRRTDWVPRLARERQRHLERVLEQLTGELGREPTPDELSPRLRVAQRHAARAAEHCRPVEMSSLSAVVTHKNGRQIELSALVDNSRPDTTARVCNRSDLRDLLLSHLTLGESLIVRLKYIDGLSLQKIGTLIGPASESRMCQRHTEIIRKLRRRCGPQLERLLTEAA